VKPPDQDGLFKNSLRIAVELAKTTAFEEYRSGFSAFENWIEALTVHAASVETNTFTEHEVHLTILNYLVDARHAAIGYLNILNEQIGLNHSDMIIGNFRKEVDLLQDTWKKILPDYDKASKFWTKDILNKQIDVLSQVLSLEKESIEIIEEQLS
jgi:hypothetical protein